VLRPVLVRAVGFIIDASFSAGGGSVCLLGAAAAAGVFAGAAFVGVFGGAAVVFALAALGAGPLAAVFGAVFGGALAALAGAEAGADAREDSSDVPLRSVVSDSSSFSSSPSSSSSVALDALGTLTLLASMPSGSYRDSSSTKSGSWLFCI